MFANILTHLNKTSAQPDTAEEPMYGRLVPPTVPGWSYPSDEHLHRDEHLRRMEQPAIPPAPSRPIHEQPETREEEQPAVQEYQPRLARLSGLPPDVLRPVRHGHDYVGGMIASLCVLTAAIALLLLELT